MGITSVRRALAIGLAVFMVSALATPSFAATNRSLTKALLQSSMRSSTLSSPVKGSTKPPKRSRYRIKSILRYATTLQVGDANLTVRVKVPLKHRSLVKFELLF